MKKSWLSMVFVLLTGIVFAIGQFKVPPAMTAILDDMNVGLTMGGLFMSIVAITAIFSALFGGFLTVRFSIKKLGIWAICCGIIGNILGYFAPDPAILLVSRLIEGIGYGLITTVAPTIIATLFPAEKRKIPMALWTIWVPVGMMIVFNISNGMTQIWGWRSVWLLCVGLFIVVLVLFILMVQIPEQQQAISNDRVLLSDKEATLSEVRNSSVWFLTLVFSIFGLGCSAFSTFAPTFCVQHLGMDAGVANAETSLMTIGMIAGAFIMMGILAAYKGKLRNMLVIVTTITGVFFSLSFCPTDANQVVPFVLINGVVLQMIPPVVFAVAPDAARSPKTVGLALGIATAGDHLGAFFGTVVLGFIVEAAGNNWSAAVPAMVIFALIGIFGAVMFSVSMRARKR
ncbi:MAG: MFS transporter [Raoultibacter sp.]